MHGKWLAVSMQPKIGSYPIFYKIQLFDVHLSPGLIATNVLGLTAHAIFCVCGGGIQNCSAEI